MFVLSSGGGGGGDGYVGGAYLEIKCVSVSRKRWEDQEEPTNLLAWAYSRCDSNHNKMRIIIRWCIDERHEKCTSHWINLADWFAFVVVPWQYFLVAITWLDWHKHHEDYIKSFDFSAGLTSAMGTSFGSPDETRMTLVMVMDDYNEHNDDCCFI